MKPFNLEAALAGAPVVTRYGFKVTQLHEFSTVLTPSLFGVIGENKCVSSWCSNGKSVDPHFDLFMAPVKKKGWLNIYKIQNAIPACIASATFVYADEATAKRNADKTILATVPIEWEE